MTLDLRPDDAARAAFEGDPLPMASAARSAPTPPACDPTEAAIRAAIAAGRRGEAIERIRRAHGRAMYGLALRMVRDPFTAEDVVQDALLRIHLGMDALRLGTRLRAWVMSVTAHRALDELRRRQRCRRRTTEAVDLSGIPDDAALAPQALATAADLRVLRQCLDKLPPRVRTSVVLYFGQELTCEEVGRLQGDHGGTVQVRVARALTRLRGQLERRGVERPGART